MYAYWGLEILSAAAVAHAGVVLPDETFAAVDQLRAVVADAAGPDPGRAADRYQSLLADHGSELVRGDGGSLVSVRQYFRAIPPEKTAAMTAAFDGKFGPSVAAKVSAIRADEGFSVTELYAVADRFPPCRSTGSTLAFAADRAADQGDVVTAGLLYDRATAAGWKPGPDHAARYAGVVADIHPAGPVPFATPWYPLVTGYGAVKVVPVAAGESVFLGDLRTVAAVSGGKLRWSFTLPDGGAKLITVGDTGRGAVCVPGLSTDRTGRATAVVVRQKVAGEPGRLRAFRASDGRKLWSTADDFPGLDFLSSPTVAGRYGYAVALELNDDGTALDLQLVAVDVTGGRVMWKTHLATVTDLPKPGQGWNGSDLNFYADQGPPAVAGETVVVSPNVGAVFAVDRIDGDLRWVRPYKTAPVEENAARAYNTLRAGGKDVRPPLSWVQLLRWTNTPLAAGGVVVAAPSDADVAVATDLQTGRPVWETTALPQGVPACAWDGKIIWAGQAVTAVDPARGAVVWTYNPPNGARLTGPPTTLSGRLVAETTAGVVSLSSADGSARPDRDAKDFPSVLTAPDVRDGLAKLGLIGSFNADGK